MLLARYSEIEQKLAALNEEREQIRTQIKSHLLGTGRHFLVAHQPNESFEIEVKHRVNVTYDEAKLKQRLGERYRLILEPDLKKLRQNLPQLKPALTPYLELIGSPTKERVQEKITSGEMQLDDFRGAFEKTSVDTLYIRRPKKL